jgi:RNA polymerase sigma-70 factor (ECF subfamily)
MGGPRPAGGESEAFLRRMSDAYRQPLMRFFRRRVGSEAEAEDLAQEVFLRLVRRLDVEPIDNPEAFLFRTAVNLLRDRARRGKTLASHREELSWQAGAFEALSPDRVLEGRQSLAGVTRALAQLDERSRDAFILHRLEGMRHADIAALYGVSVSSVEKYIIKALAHLARAAAREA